MNNLAEDIKQLMESLHYWDARVVALDCNYFGDEITLVHEKDSGNVMYRFEGCYEVQFKHLKDYDKGEPAKCMSRAQIPYFLQNIEISTTLEEEKEFLFCKIEMFPLSLKVLCTNIIVEYMEPKG